MQTEKKKGSAAMGTYQGNFMRAESKYLLTLSQYRLLMSALKGKLVPDKYPEYALRSIYFDTDDDIMIRRSIEKTQYKEKLRLRSYGEADGSTTVFLEIKKKYQGIVGKRRISLLYRTATEYLAARAVSEKPPDIPLRDGERQIFSEIDYLVGLYRPMPKQYVYYEREAFTYAEDSEVRITFDKNITGRRENLTLGGENYGSVIIGDDMRLMEVKVPGCIPFEISRILSILEIRPTSFSKYGTFYKEYILQNQREEPPCLKASAPSANPARLSSLRPQPSFAQ